MRNRSRAKKRHDAYRWLFANMDGIILRLSVPLADLWAKEALRPSPTAYYWKRWEA